MKGSVGQALRDTRLNKNLTLEEVARTTKIRPERIADLERDDYTHFPNLTYARNFLILYAKFLGVDISKYPTVEIGNTIGLGDYQYLQSEEAEKAHRPARTKQLEPPAKPRWLLVFFVFLLMLAVGALIGWGIMNYRRLGPMENLEKKDTQVLNTPTLTPAPTPLAMPTPSPETPTAPPQAAITPEPSPAAAIASLPPIPATQPEVRRAEPLPAPEAESAATAGMESPAATVPPKGEVRELKLRVSKRTKVRIVRDTPSSGSVYYGFVNPAQPTITFKGKYFWIKAADPDALQVTINGQPATGPESGVEILRNPGL